MKKFISILSICLVAVLFSINANAQGFVTPLERVQLNTETIIVKTDGTQLKGVLKTATAIMGYVKKVSFKDEAGVKIKLTAADISLIKMKPSKLAKFEDVFGKNKAETYRHINGFLAEIESRGKQKHLKIIK